MSEKKQPMSIGEAMKRGERKLDYVTFITFFVLFGMVGLVVVGALFAFMVVMHGG